MKQPYLMYSSLHIVVNLFNTWWALQSINQSISLSLFFFLGFSRFSVYLVSFSVIIFCRISQQPLLKTSQYSFNIPHIEPRKTTPTRKPTNLSSMSLQMCAHRYLRILLLRFMITFWAKLLKMNYVHWTWILPDSARI